MTTLSQLGVHDKQTFNLVMYDGIHLSYFRRKSAAGQSMMNTELVKHRFYEIYRYLCIVSLSNSFKKYTFESETHKGVETSFLFL